VKGKQAFFSHSHTFHSMEKKGTKSFFMKSRLCDTFKQLVLWKKFLCFLLKTLALLDEIVLLPPSIQLSVKDESPVNVITFHHFVELEKSFFFLISQQRIHCENCLEITKVFNEPIRKKFFDLHLTFD
jgi:hypothetical protein